MQPVILILDDPDPNPPGMREPGTRGRETLAEGPPAARVRAARLVGGGIEAT
jgi:hypothetical protein